MLGDADPQCPRLEISSIVISTNPFGDFSKCTIISELIDEDGMEGIVEEARILWQKFIHQPQTGRCLVFLLVLGKLCQKVTKTYEEAINKLTSILELDVSYCLLSVFLFYLGVLHGTWTDFAPDQFYPNGKGVVQE
jgi:hypothetical protein